jgi:hypothetical protein
VVAPVVKKIKKKPAPVLAPEPIVEVPKPEPAAPVSEPVVDDKEIKA